MRKRRLNVNKMRSKRSENFTFESDKLKKGDRNYIRKSRYLKRESVQNRNRVFKTVKK